MRNLDSNLRWLAWKPRAFLTTSNGRLVLKNGTQPDETFVEMRAAFLNMSACLIFCFAVSALAFKTLGAPINSISELVSFLIPHFLRGIFLGYALFALVFIVFRDNLQRSNWAEIYRQWSRVCYSFIDFSEPKPLHPSSHSERIFRPPRSAIK